MSIVFGKVLTLNGYVPVEKLKKNDLIIDRAGSARRLLNIEEVEVKKILTFENNKSLILSADTKLYTPQGAVSITEPCTVFIRKENNSVTPDYVKIEDNVHFEPYNVGFKLTVENGRDCFVNGYNIEL
jgi:hypothetical protein